MKLAGDVKTLEEWLETWDAGGCVWSCEMGGLGPGYEQAIQVLAVETVRALLAAGFKFPERVPKSGSAERKAIEDRFRAICDPVVARLDGGYSGAQVGAAQSMAVTLVRNGYLEAHKRIPENRRILISRDFPEAPPAPSHPTQTDGAGAPGRTADSGASASPADSSAAGAPGRHRRPR